jgi:hypothetical protein
MLPTLQTYRQNDTADRQGYPLAAARLSFMAQVVAVPPAMLRKLSMVISAADDVGGDGGYAAVRSWPMLSPVNRRRIPGAGETRDGGHVFWCPAGW